MQNKRDLQDRDSVAYGLWLQASPNRTMCTNAIPVQRKTHRDQRAFFFRSINLSGGSKISCRASQHHCGRLMPGMGVR